MSSTTLSQTRPDGIASRLSNYSLELLGRHPDLFHLTIEQLDAERQKTKPFTGILPDDATEDETARFEAQKKYIEDRRAAINIHLIRAYEDEEYKSRERWEQKRKDWEEQGKKWAEEKKVREEREKKYLVQKTDEELRRKKFYELDIGELYWERRQARHAGGVGPDGRTVEEIDKEIGEKLLGYKEGGVEGIHTIVSGIDKTSKGARTKHVMVEMGTQTDMTGPQILPMVPEPPIGPLETVTPTLPKFTVDMALSGNPISSLVKAEPRGFISSNAVVQQATTDFQVGEHSWLIYGALAAIPLAVTGLYWILFGRSSGGKARGRSHSRDWSKISDDSEQDVSDDEY